MGNPGEALVWRGEIIINHGYQKKSEIKKKIDHRKKRKKNALSIDQQLKNYIMTENQKKNKN